MARPNVTINLSNGNLGLQAPSETGTAAVLVAAPVAPVAGYGTAFLVKNKAQVLTAFGQTGNEGIVTAINDYFFGETPEGSKLYVLAMARTTTLATLMAPANAEKVLVLANGDVRLLAAVKLPDTATYVPTITEGFDQDVHAAVTAGQTLANTWFAKKQPFRFFIQGYAYAGTANTVKDYGLTTNRNGHIIIAEIAATGTATVNTSINGTLLALGRAASLQAQQNIGRIKSGSLAIAAAADVKIGGTKADAVSSADLDTLYDKRYITLDKNQIAAGYVWNDDNSLTKLTDDYNNLRYGRVIDNATRIAFATYYNELKEDVEVEEGGRLATVVEKALQTAVETNIDAGMRQQLSKRNDGTADVECLVNPDPAQYGPLYETNGVTDPNFNILASGIVYLFLQLRPKGCLKYLNVYLGFVA